MRIRLTNVWFKYSGSHEWVLRDVSTEFENGRIIVIRGHNGSGKTTLLKIASLLYKPVKGVVYVDSNDVWSTNSTSYYRGKVVYVPDKPVVVRGNVYDNIALGLRIQEYGEREIKERVNSIAEELGIEELLGKKSRELSAGEKQLVTLARVLVLNPAIMFLDEPLTYLDKERRESVIKLFNRFKHRGTGLVIVTHLYESINGLEIDEELLLEKGRLLALNH